MRISSQTGFSLPIIILAVLALAGIGGAGYYVMEKDKDKPVEKSNQKSAITNYEECAAAGNPVMDTYPEQCSADGKTFTRIVSSKFKLDKSSLPAGWNVTFDEAEIISMDNSAIDRKQEESCFVEASKVNDKDVSEATANSDAAKLNKAKKEGVQDGKGYIYEKVEDSTIKLKTSSGDLIIPSFYDHVKGPDGADVGSIQYQKNAYLIADGYYISITQSCGSKNFDQADMALLAIKFD